MTKKIRLNMEGNLRQLYIFIIDIQKKYPAFMLKFF